MKQAQRRSMAWKMPSVSAQGLKIFACVMLILGSIGMIIFEKGIINVEQYKANELNDLLAGNSALMGQVGMTVALGFIGGLALPIIAFLLTEGFFNTSSYMKYLCAVFAFALISEIPYDFAMTGKVIDFSSQNPMFATALCLVMMYFFRMTDRTGKFVSALLKFVIMLCAICWIVILHLSYGLSMVLLVSVFYLFRNKHGIKLALAFLVTLFCAFMGQGSYIGVISLYGIYCYNEHRELKCSKYVFYIIYPAHLLVLGLITRCLIR